MYFIVNTKRVLESLIFETCSPLYKTFFSGRLKKKLVLIINQLSYVSLKQYWQIFFLYEFVFTERHKIYKFHLFLALCLSVSRTEPLIPPMFWIELFLSYYSFLN